MTELDQMRTTGLEHHKAGRLAEAEAWYRKVLTIAPNDYHALHLLGVLAHDCGHSNAAVELMQRSIQLAGIDAPPAYFSNLGEAYRVLRHGHDAIACFQRALQLDPKFVQARKRLAVVLKQLGRLSEGAAESQAAIAMAPNDIELQINFAGLLFEAGRLHESVQLYRHCRQLYREPALASSLLSALAYLDDIQPADLAAEHRSWWDEYGAAEANRPRPPLANDPDPNRKLRIGYVSNDFRRHSVAYFLAPILQAHDRQNFEVFLYSSVAAPDQVTERFRAMGHWRSIVGWSTDQIENQIRADGIDVLVDLAGHTVQNALLVFARAPAPVQISYLGYPLATGLQAIDCRISDAFVDPPTEPENPADPICRVDPCAWCYEPPPSAPPVTDRPQFGTAVTFGSFNNPSKLSDACVALWARILRELPASRLVLKGKPFNDPAIHPWTRQRFERNGVDPARIDLLSHLDEVAEHLAAYSRIDIALDPFPYNGTTTTCEAMWMGVPVVTLAGHSPQARVGVSLLNNVGLGDLAAADEESYVQQATRLARDRATCRALRSTLRDRMRRSPLMDPQNFTRQFENIMRTRWRQWCAGRKSP